MRKKLLSYDQIYGFSPKCRDKESVMPAILGKFKMSQRTETRTRYRCMMLSVLLVPLLVWTVIKNQLVASSPDAVESQSRQLAKTSILPALETGFDCLSVEEYQDKEAIKLTMVRKYHVTMGGFKDECLNGNDFADYPDCKKKSRDCASGEGPCLIHAWTLLVYIPGMFYMFIALALVCDEFFVPALEAFVEHYEISMDVAGATFMAAGGSMPELFTSLISTFDQSEVGFAAIVGSAVFNVLFVISVCTLASDEPLQLTGWPLARDCSFYVIALLLVFVFLQFGPSKEKIEFYEALILFCWYACYCVFMKFNSRLHAWVQGSRTSDNAVAPEPTDAEEGTRSASKEPRGMSKEANDLQSQRKDTANLRMPSTFRGGIVSLLTQSKSLVDTAGIQVVTALKGNLKEAFNAVDADKDGKLNESEFFEFMTKLGYRKEDHITDAWKCMPTKGGFLLFDTFKKWYLVSEARVEIEVRRVFDHLDKNGDGWVDQEEISVLLTSLGHKPTTNDLSEVVIEIINHASKNEEYKSEDVDTRKEVSPKGASGDMDIQKVTYEQFEGWYSQSMFAAEMQKQHEIEEKQDDVGFSIDWPEEPTSYQLFWYVVTYPLCAAMYCSLPDVRRPGMEGKVHWAIVEFLISLVWIAVFSNMLYECLMVVANTIGIPPTVAGVTILAGGTSIPDLLSSYIVARKGEGDMAVSSSIGSNIFDVTVGLPLPWMLFIIVQTVQCEDKTFVEVSGKGLTLSILVLVFMLAAVLVTIWASGWKMTKQMGGVMMVLYFLFIVQYMLQKLPSEGKAPIKAF